MSKTQKMWLVAIAGAVAIYLAIRWYENRQASQNGTTQGGAGEGSNLNSVAPELIGGSTGPSIGPALSTPITINVTNPPSMANPVGALSPDLMVPDSSGVMTGVVGNTSTLGSPLAAANPSNSISGAQSAAPMSSDTSGAGIASAGTGTTARTPASSSVTQPTTKTGQAPPKPPAAKTPTPARTPAPKPITRPGTPRKRAPRKKAAKK